METTRARVARIERHAHRLATVTYREAGTQAAVGRAIGRSGGTVGHYETDRPDPRLWSLFTGLLFGARTDALPLMEAMDDAYELHAVIMRETPDLIRDGLSLLAQESERDGAEDDAALCGSVAHAEALDRYRCIARRLALTIRELHERGVDLHALYRERRRVA